MLSPTEMKESWNRAPVKSAGKTTPALNLSRDGMNTLSPPPERERPLNKAHQQILYELNRLNLQADIAEYGDRPAFAHVQLRSILAERYSSGSGKGYKHAALVGALYEALEHYLIEHHYQDTHIHYQSNSYFKQLGFLFDDSLLDLITQQSPCTLACRHYSNPLDGKSFSYPLILTQPHYADSPLPEDHFDYRALRRYSSDSGTAIGATHDEAVLHGINECIGRDAVSLFLLAHFYYGHDVPLHRVLPVDSASPLGQLWHDVERQLDTEVVVLTISSEFAAKTYLAFTRTEYPHASVFGSGTSLNAHSALSHALSELVQLHLATQHEAVRQSLVEAQHNLAAFPRLQRCQLFDTHYLLSRPYSWVALPADEALPSLRRQITRLAQDLRAHRRELGVCTLYRSESGTSLVSVVIPGLERFFIVGSGNVVVPQARGLARYGQRHGVSA